MSIYTVALTGASGAVYAKRLLEFLIENRDSINMVISDTAKLIVHSELEFDIPKDKSEAIEKIGKLLGSKDICKTLRYYEAREIDAPLASGSNRSQGMVIIPCSMGTLSRIAHGVSTNLIERAADVILKEKRPLILVPRETPLNVIHIENMLSLARLGAYIVPAMPAFYTQPKTIDDMVNFMVGRVLDLLGIEHRLYPRWGEEG
ncbi:MAG: flavin prenyltransferase UbiX [Thermodesulfobacteriota bacterium]|nr:flavin prenyltransferase UbiX [Thermodesulfobacteriota bacterium]